LQFIEALFLKDKDGQTMAAFSHFITTVENVCNILYYIFHCSLCCLGGGSIGTSHQISPSLADFGCKENRNSPYGLRNIFQKK
jgi:hypothetical protein